MARAGATIGSSGQNDSPGIEMPIVGLICVRHRAPLVLFERVVARGIEDSLDGDAGRDVMRSA